MAEARSPGLPLPLIFRSQPEAGWGVNWHEKASTVAKVLVLPRQAPVAAMLPVRPQRALLLLAASEFFAA